MKKTGGRKSRWTVPLNTMWANFSQVKCTTSRILNLIFMLTIYNVFKMITHYSVMLSAKSDSNPRPSVWRFLAVAQNVKLRTLYESQSWARDNFLASRQGNNSSVTQRKKDIFKALDATNATRQQQQVINLMGGDYRIKTVASCRDSCRECPALVKSIIYMPEHCSW